MRIPRKTSFQGILLVLFCTLVLNVPTLAKKSLYDTLGVTKGCNASELKKGYRKQCLQHHPDKGGNEDAFKEVTKAYDILSDDSKRKAYDTYGDSALNDNGDMPSPQQQPFYGGPGGGGGGAGSFFSSFGGGGGPSGAGGFNFGGMDFGGATSRNSGTGGLDMNIEDLLRHMAGGQNSGGGGLFGVGGYPQQQSSPRPPPKAYTRACACTLEELATGATKKMKVKFGANRSKIYTVQLQKGWKAGTKVKFNASKDGRLGAMTFVIQEKKHSLLERRGDDLVYRHDLSVCKNTPPSGNVTKTVNAKDETVKIELVLPDGEVWMRSLSKSSSFLREGQTLTVTDKGMPIKGGPSRGNLIIEFFDSSASKTNSRGSGSKRTTAEEETPPKAKQQPS